MFGCSLTISVKKADYGKALVLSAVLTVAATVPLFPVKASSINKFWAVIIIGNSPADRNAFRLNDILSTYYDVDEVDGPLYCSKEMARAEITEWLASRSDYGDLVLIFFTCHGVGYDIKTGEINGRIDVDGDEGPEIYNASSSEWFGVDEGLVMYDNQIYWDDELKEDLKSVKYGRLIVLVEACKLENSTDGLSCYCGGLIDDISGPRRIIVTATNETTSAYLEDVTRRGWFFKFFVEALNPETHFDEADTDGDGAVSILEAFYFAVQHDPVGPCGLRWETPWLDDDGDRLPTFKYGQDWIDSEGYYLAAQTWLNKTMYSGNVADIDNDYRVDGIDVWIVSSHFGGICNPYANEKWYPLADVNYDNIIDGIDMWIVAKNFGWQK